MRSALILACIAGIAAAAGCGGRGGGPATETPEPARGKIVSLETGADDAITGFTLRTADEQSLEIAIADDVDYGFDLAHLREHMSTGDPVSCKLEERDGRLYALTVEDVPVPGAP